MKRWIGFLLGTAVLGVPTWALACQTVCGDATKISAGETGMPANTPSLLLELDFACSQDAPFTLKEVGGSDVPFTMEGCCQLTPDAPFQANTTYVVSRDLEPGEGALRPMKETFTTGNVEPFPESMGDLSVVEIKWEPVGINTDSCWSSVDAVYADVELDLPEQAHTWRGGLIIQTYVNGLPWRGSGSQGATYKPGETWMGYGKDRVYVLCDERHKNTNLQKFQEGSHEIQMVGTIPGTEVRIESNTVTVDLHCNPPAPAEEESGCSAAGGVPFALSLLILGALRRRRRV